MKGFNMKKYSLIALLFLFAVSMKAQSEVTKYNIDNCVSEFSKEKTEPTKVGYQFWFADKNFADGKTLKLSVVAPGKATHPPHKHSEDEFFFVLAGTAEFYLDGETKTAGPMTSFYCPTGSEHGIRNVGDSELKYLVIKKYEQK
jgi:mannose-6-phosphate isomerase-like protein (cupin superfamily)